MTLNNTSITIWYKATRAYQIWDSMVVKIL